MPTTTPSGWTRLPTVDDVPNVPADMLKMAVDLEARISPLNRSRNEPVELEQNKNAAQSIPNATWTKITTSSITYDARASSGDLGTHSDGIITVTAGRYYVEGTFVWETATGTGRRGIGFGKVTDAAPLARATKMEYFVTGQLHYMQLGATFSTLAGDQICIWAYQQGGAAANASSFNYSVRRLRVSDP